MADQQLPSITIYLDKSVLTDEKGNTFEFAEGVPSEAAKKRLAAVRAALEEKYLENLITNCQKPDVKIENLTEDQIKLVEKIVNSVTSEVGRAIIGICVLQLTIKSIIPDQSIRLHKGSKAAEFSWEEGIPMRVLDSNFITPVLRKFNLLKLNADGFMMTRSLAENYPYSKLYKAAIKGAKSEWLELTDLLETGAIDSRSALMQMIVFLNNKSEHFLKLTKHAIAVLSNFAKKKPSFDQSFAVIKAFIDDSTYSARMFEVAIHALIQVIAENRRLAGHLKPLSQMRSANKKHGNIGDIEITQTQGRMDIVESWDAKYGKPYLRDELEELSDKLTDHPQASLVGFVTDTKPSTKSEITERIEEFKSLYAAEVKIMSFDEWTKFQIDRYELEPNKLGLDWLTALTESICQLRREIAPIDEPTTEWVVTLIKTLEK